MNGDKNFGLFRSIRLEKFDKNNNKYDSTIGMKSTPKLSLQVVV